MSLNKEFHEFLEEEIKKVDFKALYEDIKIKDVYSPVKIEEAIFITINRILKSNSRTTNEKLVGLNNMIGMLKDKDYTPHKIQLLSIVVELSKINDTLNNSNSDENLSKYYL